jgi:hypothetical protein
MDDSLSARLATLARSYVAMALTVADGAGRYAALTLASGEQLVRAIEGVLREGSDPKGGGWDHALDSALASYREYLRELAALPGIASMTYYEQLDSLRAAAAAHKASSPSTGTPPPATAPESG